MVLQLYSFQELNVADVLEMCSNLHNIFSHTILGEF
jgi:hypothetical protein